MNILTTPSRSHSLILPESLSKKKEDIWLPEKERFFHIRKYEDKVIKTPFETNIEIGNYIRIEKFNHEDGRSQWLTPWFHNNITNTGLDLLATSTSRWTACQVGTGNAAVADTNTTLQTFLAGTTTTTSVVQSFSGAPFYYTELSVRYDFNTGAVVGNISEVGIGPLATVGSSLFCRELIRDETGTPVTLAVTALETLRVHYKIRLYPVLVDVVGSVNGTISGGAASRNFTRRAIGVNSSTWEIGFGGSINGYLFGRTSRSFLNTNALTAITDTGQAGSFQNTISLNSYTNGSFSRTSQLVYGPSVANQANTKLQVFSTGTSDTSRAVSYQIVFDSPITKTNLQTLTLTVQTSWSRYAP